MPLLGPDSQSIRQDLHANYTAGSWGPPQADRLFAAGGGSWHNPTVSAP